MNLLALDTSTRTASVALMIGTEVLCKTDPERSLHAQWILPSIQGLLADGEIGISQLDGIVFGQGPGSFTGLRIACSVAKGLAYAHDLPVYPVSCLKAIANELQYQHPKFRSSPILAVIDASMNQLYWSLITIGSEIEAYEERVSFAQDMASMLSLPHGIANNMPIVLAGVGYASYLAQLTGSIPDQITNRGLADLGIQDCFEIYPTATAMLRMIVQGSIVSTTAEQAMPVYIRNQVAHEAIQKLN